MSNLLKQIAPFALNVIAAASTALVMLGSLILAPLILAGVWLANQCAADPRVVA
ncbi:hypothetical protein [Methylomagnum ishizawai]|uniref:hypothetical protein n=1 Tax=Methylomagnum ishizawai TaxID=1760988 RepID=UPI001C32ABD5|nr:hypothetical protein [Methylomagnum ishizawai]BBL77373.1 hypothetical protein MishRS11D_44710 [Methylomagnum ishizawai]